MTSADMNPLTSHPPGLMGREKYDDTRHIFELRNLPSGIVGRSACSSSDVIHLALHASRRSRAQLRLGCGVGCFAPVRSTTFSFRPGSSTKLYEFRFVRGIQLVRALLRR
jgi:hypothetical protein